MFVFFLGKVKITKNTAISGDMDWQPPKSNYAALVKII